VILASFPQVEGPTSVEQPATGRLDRTPISSHARTRLEEERLLFERTDGTSTSPVVLRFGMVYGRGILMIEAARWLARRRLLCVWRSRRSTTCCQRRTSCARSKWPSSSTRVRGIYHIGDDQPVSIQEFLDQACRVWGYRRPFRVPFPLIYAAACFCELRRDDRGDAGSTDARLRGGWGRVPHWGNTDRARKELIPELILPTLQSGLSTL